MFHKNQLSVQNMLLIHDLHNLPPRARFFYNVKIYLLIYYYFLENKNTLFWLGEEQWKEKIVYGDTKLL